MSDFAWWLGVAAVPWLGVALQIALAAYQWRLTQRMKVIRATFATIGSDAGRVAAQQACAIYLAIGMHRGIRDERRRWTRKFGIPDTVHPDQVDVHVASVERR